jgi:hypothetical protein
MSSAARRVKVSTLLAKPGRAGYERPGLPGARACEYEQRSALMGSGSSLIVIENIQNARRVRHGH